MCAGKLEEPGNLEKSGNRAEDAENVQPDHEEEWLGEMAVEESAVHDTALRCDVEAAQFWIDEGEYGGQKDVRREHGLVDVVPEGVAVLPLDARVRDVGEREMRKGVGEDGRPVAGNVDVAEDKIDQRRREEDQARKSVEKVRHRVEVAEPLRRAESASEEWIVGAHDLDHAACPANALLDVSAQPFGGEARGLGDVDVGRVPTVLLHAQ